MSHTSWEERREYEERLYSGQATTAHETQRLIDDADAGERAEAILAALQKVLRSQLGLLVVESTTDDDCSEIRIELIAEGDGNMGSFHIPSVDHRVAPATGAGTAIPIPVPGIGANDVILAVIMSKPSGNVAGLDPAAFTPAAGEIESATVDTTGKSLIVIHTVGAVA